MMRRWHALAVIPLLLALALTACTGMPTSGPVGPGLRETDDQDTLPIAFLPDRPQPGATPEQIVDGFLRAGSGPSDNWAIARLYLAPDIHDSWQPNAGVTVDSLPDRTLGAVGDTSGTDAAVSVGLTPLALVDGNGAYSDVDVGPTQLSFQLAKQSDGEWRITKAPDGIVLDSDTFPRVYRSYSLMYFDPAWRHLVPDVRWYPSVNAPTRIVNALVNGDPSPWLARSVVTAFPDDVNARAAVPVVDGVAQVEIGAAALSLPTSTLDRMQTQLDQSLATASISDVRMTAGGATLSATPVPTDSTTVDPRALVKTDQNFGFLSGDQIDPLPGFSPAIQPLDVHSIQLGWDGSFAAVRLGDGSVQRIPSGGAPVTVDNRPDLIDPTSDPNGFIWTVPSSKPAAVVATAPDGTHTDIGAAWPSAVRIVAMQVSRDGARVAALVVVAGRSSVRVAGIIRDESGRPTSIGPVQELVTLVGNGVALGWIDDTTIGVVAAGDTDSTVLEQPVGGIATTSSVPAPVTAIAGAGQSVVRVTDSSGNLYLKRVTNWQQAGSGIRVLATLQGRVS
ncbi:LpqB family beta-propeller domain-containing protein [Microbacterium sp. X-17]|uniref:LpqB family beta-propeller domain-containing protein n=1 Tax=Microbacterium sp. X-17 TaxID=3144404 RepID=UPI0031F54B24